MVVLLLECGSSGSAELCASLDNGPPIQPSCGILNFLQEWWNRMVINGCSAVSFMIKEVNVF